jgi:hypothetical protein
MTFHCFELTNDLQRTGAIEAQEVKHTRALPIGVGALGYYENGQLFCRIVNCVHDAVLAESHPPVVDAANGFLCASGARIVR